MRNFSEVKKLVSDKVTTFNQLPGIAKTAAAGLLSAAIATANQPEGCNSQWTQNFAITLATVVGVGASAPLVYQEVKKRFFEPKKKVKFDETAIKETTSPKK